MAAASQWRGLKRNEKRGASSYLAYALKWQNKCAIMKIDMIFSSNLYQWNAI